MFLAVNVSGNVLSSQCLWVGVKRDEHLGHTKVGFSYHNAVPTEERMESNWFLS